MLNLQSPIKPCTHQYKVIMDPRNAQTGPCLPTELRLQIWKFAFTPKTIKVDLEADRCDPDNISIFYGTRRSLPLTLFINSESRHYTLKFYRHLFEKPLPIWRTQSQISFLTLDEHPMFNPQIDTIEFWVPTRGVSTFRLPNDSLDSLRRRAATSLDSIQMLAIGADLSEWVTFPDIRSPDLAADNSFLAYFRGLKKLRVVRDYDMADYISGVFVYRERLKYSLGRISEAIPEWKMPEIEIITPLAP